MSKESTAALAILRRVMAEPGLEQAHREMLRKGAKELEKLSRTGKPNRDKVFRAVFLITSGLLEAKSRTMAPLCSTDQNVTLRAR